MWSFLLSVIALEQDRGTDGIVSFITEADGSRFAVKENKVYEDIRDTLDSANLLKHEIETYSVLKHENIVEMIKFQEATNSEIPIYKLYMEVCQAFNTHRYTLGRLIDIFHQLAKALEYIHKKGYCHNDIKPANILECASSRFKLCDFAFSSNKCKELDGHRGTPLYMSPLVKYNFDNKRDPTKFRLWNGFKSDIYSLGETFLFLYYPKATISTRGIAVIDFKIIQRRLKMKSMIRKSRLYIAKAYSSISGTSHLFELLLLSMTVTNEDERPTMEEILKNPFWDYIKKPLKRPGFFQNCFGPKCSLE